MTTELTAIVYGVNNPWSTRIALRCLRENSTDRTRIVLVDNGSDPPYERWDADEVIRYEENIGANAVFHRLFQEDRIARTTYTAFFHVDLYVLEPRWDVRVIQAFQDVSDLGLLGFVGSDEIDELGGRGNGTMLNFQGRHYEGVGQAYAAAHHGAAISDLRPAAVLDHCAMIFRTATLLELTPQEGHYAPEHFYDRILCCEVLARGEHIAVLGIQCDHISGGIGAGGLPNAKALRQKWLAAEGIVYDPERSYIAVRDESERRFLARWRDRDWFIPLKVKRDWSLEHQHYSRGGPWRPHRRTE